MGNPKFRLLARIAACAIGFALLTNGISAGAENLYKFVRGGDGFYDYQDALIALDISNGTVTANFARCWVTEPRRSTCAARIRKMVSSTSSSICLLVPRRTSSPRRSSDRRSSRRVPIRLRCSIAISTAPCLTLR